MYISNESTDVFVCVSPGIKVLRRRLNNSPSSSGVPVKGDWTGGALNKTNVLRRSSVVSCSGASAYDDVTGDESSPLEVKALCVSDDVVNEKVSGRLE